MPATRTALAVRRDPRLDARAAAAAVADERGADLAGGAEHRQPALRPRAGRAWRARSRQQVAVERSDGRRPVAACALRRQRRRAAARRRRRPRLLPGAGARGELRRRRPRPAGAAGRGRRRRRGELRFRDDSMRERAGARGLPVAAGAAAERRRRGAGAGGRDAGQALAPGHRDHQGRDPAAVRDPAAGGAAGVVRAGARHRAAERAAAAHPARATATTCSPIDERDVPEEVAPLVRRDQRPAGAAGPVDRRAEALPGRRRAPAEDAAGRPAHAGRAGAARDRHRPARPDVAEAARCSRSRCRASAPRTWSTSCWRWRAPRTRSRRAPRQPVRPGRGWRTETVRDFVPQGAGQAHRPRLRRPRAGAALRGAAARPAGAAARAGAQPGRQRAAVHARRRHGDGARDRRPVRPGGGAAGRGHRPRHPAGRARAGVPALLPRAGHQRRRQRPGPGDRAARSRSQHGAQITVDDADRARATACRRRRRAAAGRAVHGALSRHAGHGAGCRVRPAGAAP